ncbi:electron transport complex subunit RsxD [Alteromonas gilva]|uniref:Ion-translocating oxidoreductase complex subunit D n=1 Tax=Alteromonas gilva TaxID=2987522 RepID=A0ABT5L433_9ALTE|nr:electron transport complex subunit RsxD [Alteromonas gilva]MDC8831617.1 electron transport complex subunit RsxD [Alteromonas gilva]
MKLAVSSSPHQHVRRTTDQVMRLVLYAMIPGVLAQVWFFGWGVFWQMLIALATALVTEAAIVALRKREIGQALGDYSAVVTALLLAVSLPPLLPWWMTVVGTFFAIAIVKQLYGGLGYNLFNPAMAAYVMLLISFPAAMSSWLPPADLARHTIGIFDALQLIVGGFDSAGYNTLQLRAGIDGVTMATPLDYVKTQIGQGYTYTEALSHSLFNDTLWSSASAGWTWVALLYAAGGLALIQLRVISWHIPLSLLAGVAVTATLLTLLDGDLYGSALFHWSNGAIMFGAFFIATDPVSASTTPRGRLIFGAAIGFWTVIIRTFGGYPDAIAFSVIIMNMAVPLIDYYTQPTVYGQHRGPKKKANQQGES